MNCPPTLHPVITSPVRHLRRRTSRIIRHAHYAAVAAVSVACAGTPPVIVAAILPPAEQIVRAVPAVPAVPVPIPEPGGMLVFVAALAGILLIKGAKQ